MSKVKFEIKNRWTGSALFKYEKEYNTLKNTIEEAVKQGANLEGANLKGADLEGAYLRGADLEDADLGGAYLRGADIGGAYLRGANLGGANLGGANLGGVDLRGADLGGADLEGAYIYVSNSEIDAEDIVKKFEEKNNIKVTKYYINRSIIPTKWSCFWKYGLIICDYKVIQIKKLTTKEAEKELSEKYECEVRIED